MELVYLWVEKYKNIEKQGFNFSPRFECDYNPDTNELTIDENDDYIENFFGDNINVTAIVGKNGSGKSSVLTSLDSSIWKTVHYLYLKNGKLYSNFFTTEKTNGYTIETEYLINNILYLNKIFHIELENTSIFSNFALKNLYQEEFYSKPLHNKNILDGEIFHKNIIKLILNGSLNPTYFNPTKIKLSIKQPDIYSDIPKKVLKLIAKKNKTDEEKEKLKELNKKNDLKVQYKIYLKLLQLSKDKDKDKDKKLKKFFEEDISSILDFEYIPFPDLYFDIKIDSFLELLDNQLSISKDFKDFKKQFFNNNELKNAFFYLNKIGFLNYNFYDDKGKDFSSLSSGEKILFIELNLINKSIREHIKNNHLNKYHKLNYEEDNEFLLCLDEPDITLHPDWQKRYIDTLLLLLKSYSDIKFHIILTTHSPFLLSDIPKQNIIFLDTDNEGNCKVVDGLNDKKETFGANIHTLLSDSFFMEDGLMGEFAKNKIRTIKVAHRYVLHKHKRKILFTQSCKRCRRLLIKQLPKFWQIQNIIGEPFLQKIVKNQLEEIELILLGKDEAIDKEIARLQALKEGR